MKIIIVIVGVLLSAVAISPCAASDEVGAWLERELAEAAGPIETVGYQVCLEKIYRPSRSADQLREIAARIEGRPDHPDRSLLEIETRRLTNGGDRFLICCATRDDERFRYSTTQKWDGAYSDIGFDGRAAWSLTGAQLNIVDPDRAPMTKDFASARGVVDVYVSWFFHGGLRFLPAGSVEIVELNESSPDAYRARLTNADQDWDAEVQFRWDGSLGRGFVESVEYVRSGDPDLVGSGYRVEGWSYSEALERWVADAVHVRQFGDDFEFRLQDVRALSEDAFDAIVGVPDALGADPVRGKVTVASVYDHRAESDRVVFLDADRVVESEGALGDGGRGGGGGAVWVIRGVLIGCLLIAVGLWVKHRRG